MHVAEMKCGKMSSASELLLVLVLLLVGSKCDASLSSQSLCKPITFRYSNENWLKVIEWYDYIHVGQ